MTNSSWSLNDLTINPDRNPAIPHRFTREKMLVLGWLIFNQKDRTFYNMARDCSLNIHQCEITVQQLIELDIIRFR
ncbi:MAG: hypothetical protein F6J93_14225 [Oscillatoria sp. SIO1A7]|nr:hypothetical protein [Oscillatoria sp. SIO1A7]